VSNQQAKETRFAWSQNTASWDNRMGEGNNFVEAAKWRPIRWLGDHYREIA